MNQTSCRGGWGRRRHRHHAHEGDDVDHRGMLFGVRRPLRFMAHRLDLDEDQIQILAGILAKLKTERAQAAVDEQRTVALFADAMEAGELETGRVDQGLELRMQSSARLRDAVRAALAETHAMLRPDQRKQLSYMLRSGALTI